MPLKVREEREALLNIIIKGIGGEFQSFSASAGCCKKQQELYFVFVENHNPSYTVEQKKSF